MVDNVIAFLFLLVMFVVFPATPAYIVWEGLQDSRHKWRKRVLYVPLTFALFFVVMACFVKFAVENQERIADDMENARINRIDAEQRWGRPY
jgi:uncharacterized BrkB/YihY/UPF0761 family membrane protein